MADLLSPGSAGLGQYRVDPATGAVHYAPGAAEGWPVGVTETRLTAAVRDAAGAWGFASVAVDVTRAAAVLWSPADTTTILWLDAADGSVFTESGGLASEWRDKSGNSRHVAASGAARPNRGSVTRNELSAVTFDGDQVMTRGDSLGLTGNPGFVAVMVSRPLVSTNTIAALSLYTTTDTTVGKSISLNPSDGSFRFNNGNGVFNTGAADGSLWIMGTWNRPTGGNYQSGSYRQNGANVARTSSANPTFVPSITSPFGFGVGSQIIGDPALGWSTHGPLPIGELVMLPAGAASSVIDQVEGYLAWKWDLVSGLPGGHPYKAAAP